jgi:hypothetical protein
VHQTSDPNALRNQRWAIACSAITFAATIVVVALHLHPIGVSFFVGTRAEGSIILVLTAFWAATVSIVSDARNGLAVSQRDGSVMNGNLYYFSWAGFVCSVMLIVSYLHAVFGVDLAGEIKNRAARLMPWSALLAAELVVLGSTANIFDQDCSPLNETVTFCNRTKYGISLGVIGSVMSLIIVGLKIVTTSASFLMEVIFSFILTIMNAVGVALLTATDAPGAALGNLYYFIWISLLCSAMILANCYETYRAVGSSHEAGNEDSNYDKGDDKDIAVEPLDDNI